MENRLRPSSQGARETQKQLDIDNEGRITFIKLGKVNFSVRTQNGGVVF